MHFIIFSCFFSKKALPFALALAGGRRGRGDEPCVVTSSPTPSRVIGIDCCWLLLRRWGRWRAWQCLGNGDHNRWNDWWNDRWNDWLHGRHARELRRHYRHDGVKVGRHGGGEVCVLHVLLRVLLVPDVGGRHEAVRRHHGRASHKPARSSWHGIHPLLRHAVVV